MSTANRHYNYGELARVVSNSSDHLFMEGDVVRIIEHNFIGMICESLDGNLRQILIESDVEPLNQ